MVLTLMFADGGAKLQDSIGGSVEVRAWRRGCTTDENYDSGH